MISIDSKWFDRIRFVIALGIGEVSIGFQQSRIFLDHVQDCAENGERPVVRLRLLECHFCLYLVQLKRGFFFGEHEMTWSEMGGVSDAKWVDEARKRSASMNSSGSCCISLVFVSTRSKWSPKFLLNAVSYFIVWTFAYKNNDSFQSKTWS